MKLFIVVISCFLSLSLSAKEIDPGLIPKSFLKHIEKTLSSSRYMEKNCKSTTYADWENLPLEMCQYKVSGGKKADVIMLNPDALQLGAWIVDSCQYINKANDSCHKKLYKSIRYASGAQFVIAGVVYENLDGDKKYEAYPFRHGVTVSINSFSTGTESKLSNQQLKDALYAKVVSTKRYARIASTSREDYYDYMENEGLTPVDVGYSSANKRKNTWMDVIRDLYQEAWGQQENGLIRAWANNHQSSL